MTDIELMPDGRIFVFGTSWEVLDVLNRLRTKQDALLQTRRNVRCEAKSHAADTIQRDPTS